MFDNILQEYKQDAAYEALQTEANSKLNEWVSEGLEDIKVLDSCTWKLDEAVFFNSKKNKAYLLLLIQDDDTAAELDYVYMIYAALESKQWKIYFAGLPNLVFPRQQFGDEPIPLEQLSKLARTELLKTYIDRSGNINNEFVERSYTADLKAKQARFLENK